MPYQLYSSVQANAWTGTATLKGEGIDPDGVWGLRRRLFVPRSDPMLLGPPPLVDERNWRHPKVGWGLVVPDCNDASEQDRAVGADLSLPLQRLLAARPGSPILRYLPGAMNGFLRRYFGGGKPPRDLETSASATGIGDDELPKYLLICGGPDKIPWRMHYALNMSRCVGRLDLDEDGLANYVEHLVNDWGATECDRSKPVIWSVNLGSSDITWLMQKLIADAVWDKMAGDPEFSSAVRLKCASATCGTLAGALAGNPGLVITTSHGMTGGGSALLPAQLGLPVDVNHALLTPEVLPAASLPGGAIWYAHACCSAGSDASSQFADLFPIGHTVGEVLRSVSRDAGSMTSPLARRLLGAATPVRAFVGHVEPTFDWTLRDPFTGQALGHVFAAALYDRLYQPGMPIALAMSKVHAQAGTFLTIYADAIADVNLHVAGAAAVATYRQVAALDRQSMVILGDPTVSLPLPR